MRTGAFIKLQYEKEWKRIIQELVDIIPALNNEKEIMELHKNLKALKTIEIDGLGCTFGAGGHIDLYVASDRFDWPILDLAQAPYNSNEFTQIVTSEKLEKSNIHISRLREIHPKRLHEILLYSAKKMLL